jgi:CheY-like chemotaxis protein
MGEGRILVVDDERDFLVVMQKILGRAGYEVVSASCATEGLEKLKYYTPDLVLLDVMLPDMSGWEACRRIKEEGDTRVVLLTVPVGSSLEGDLASSGCDAFLEKPVSRKMLLGVVEDLLGQ